MMRRFLWTCRTEVVRSMCTSWRTLVQYSTVGVCVCVGNHDLRGSISFCEDVVEYSGMASRHGLRANHTVAVKMKHLWRFYEDFPTMKIHRSTAHSYEVGNGISSGRAFIVGQQ
jgi:hypothetical protein